MATYKIVSHAGAGLPLNVATTTTISARTNVNIWSDTGSKDQKWSISSLGNAQQVKTLNNMSYMLNANTSTWNCDVYTSNTDTYINFCRVSTGVYRLQLKSNPSKYLTAAGTASGSNVSWAELDSSSAAQKWSITEITSSATTTLSKEGAVEWIGNIIGQTARDYDGVSGVQCADLPKIYLKEYFGLEPKSFGNGGNVYSGVVSYYPEVFQKIEATNGMMVLEPGDIVSMHGTGNNGYGHVALVESVSGSNVRIAEQWSGCGNVRGNTYTYTSTPGSYFYLYGVARPIF